MNRGILLGGIVFVGVGCYVAVDQHNFKSEKPEIESVVTGFVEGLGSYNVTPEKYREKGTEVSEADAETLKKDYWEFVDKYWVSTEEETDPNYSYKSDKSGVKGQMSMVIDNWRYDHSESCDIEVRDCKVSKDGPGAAIASVKVKYVVTGTSTNEYLTPYCIESMNWWSDNGESGKESVRTFSCDAEYTIYLERTSDGWKITGSEGYVNSVNDITSDDGDSGKDEGETGEPEAMETENEADGESGQTADEKAEENI